MRMIGYLLHTNNRFPAKQRDAILAHITAHRCLAISCLFYHVLCQEIQSAILPEMLGDTKFARAMCCCYLSNNRRYTLDKHARIEKIRHDQYSAGAESQTALQALGHARPSNPRKGNLYCGIVPALPQEPCRTVDLSICLGVTAPTLDQEHGGFGRANSIVGINRSKAVAQD